MSRPLFLRILADVECEVPWFTQRFDTRGRRGISSVQKCTAALRQMAYGTTSDMFDEYLKMSSQSISPLSALVSSVVAGGSKDFQKQLMDAGVYGYLQRFAVICDRSGSQKVQ
ncbi:unnamed protein product [Cuscuta campestris]|uniref:Uncharacterized protein n=1 Tax=Cuscuta campestris TaxID=132261 RepID=A0A484LH74_9ASTE|nr:unnamed protein product [Cuscuta campestris]